MSPSLKKSEGDIVIASVRLFKKKRGDKDPQKKYRLGTVSKIILLEGLNRFNGTPTSPLVQMLIIGLHVRPLS